MRSSIFRFEMRIYLRRLDLLVYWLTRAFKSIVSLKFEHVFLQLSDTQFIFQQVVADAGE